MAKTAYLALAPVCFSLARLNLSFLCPPQLSKGPYGSVQVALSAR